MVVSSIVICFVSLLISFGSFEFEFYSYLSMLVNVLEVVDFHEVVFDF